MKSFSRQPQRGIVLLLLTVLFIWFGNLEYRTLVKPDEGRYAEIPREMVVSGDWVTPRLNDLKYFEKPPLQYWATATAYTVFGQHQWTSRLWAALTGFAGILLVWFAGERLFGRLAGRYAALLLGSSVLYALMGHINTLDMGVTFFLTLGIVSLLIAQQEKNPRWMYAAWVALGLAVLSKGLMGLVLPGAALFIYAVLQRDWTLWKRINLFSGLLLCVLVTLPWFYLVMQANPEFFDRFFIYEHYTRFTTKQHGRFHPWHYFIPILLAGMLPWTLLMFHTAARTWRSSAYVGRAFNAARFLLVWAVFIYFFFSISGSKLPSYLLPMFPALALLMGKELAAMEERKLFWLIAPMLPLAVAGLVAAPRVAGFADTPLQAAMYGEYAYWVIAAAWVWLLGIVAGLLLLWRNQKSIAVVVLALSTLLAAQIGLSGHNTVARERSALHIANAIRSEVQPSKPFYSIGMYEQTLTFYLKHTFTLVAYQDEMDFGIKQEPQRWIADFAGFKQAWEAQPAALAIMPVYHYPQLQQMGIPMQEIFRDEQFVVVKKP